MQSQQDSSLDALFEQYEGQKNAPRGGQNKTGQKFEPRMTKEEKKKKYFTPENSEETVRIVKIASNKYYETVKFHDIMVNNKSRKFYCLENDGKDCPLCSKHKEQVAEAFENTEKGSQERKDALTESNKLEARNFYILKLVDRGRIADGYKYYRVKHNFKNNGVLDKILMAARSFKTKTGKDFTDAIEGVDMDIAVIKSTTPRGYTYPEVASVTIGNFGNSSPLTADEKTASRLESDLTTWKDLYTPIAIREYLDETQFLQAVADRRAPEWDEKEAKWQLTNPDGTKYFATYAPRGEQQAQTPQAQQPTQASLKSATSVSLDIDDLPF